MTLTQLSYLILEQITNNKIVDDQEVSLKLIKDWILLKRATFLKNRANTNYDINLNNVQTYQFVVSKIDSVTTPSNYPFVNGTTQKYTIFESAAPIPKIVENVTGPMVLEFGNEDLNTYG